MVSRAGRAGRSGRAGARGRGRGGPRWAGGALGEARPRAGGLGGVSMRRGRGSRGGDAASGGGSVPGGRARGWGFFVRSAAARSGQRRRRGAAAALRGAGVSPHPPSLPATAARSSAPQAGLWVPRDASGYLKLTEEVGVLAPPGWSGGLRGLGVGARVPGDVWRPFRRWGN